MTGMPQSIMAALEKRSSELKLPWCELLPVMMGNFLAKQWILIVDDRVQGHRAVVVIPREMLEHFDIVLNYLSKATSEKHDNP